MLMIEQKEAWHIQYVLYISFHEDHVHFLDITWKSIIGDNDYTELRALLMLMFVRTFDFLRVSINQYSQHFWALLHTFRLAVLLEPMMLAIVVHLIQSEEGKHFWNILQKKNCVYFDFIPLIH